jgi:hypothetical protein
MPQDSLEDPDEVDQLLGDLPYVVVRRPPTRDEAP